VPVTDSIDKIADTVVRKLSYLKSFKRGQ
jgi:hypothetical protein